MLEFWVGFSVAVLISAIGLLLELIVEGLSWESTIRGYERFPVFLLSSCASGCAATVFLSQGNMATLTGVVCFGMFLLLLLDIVLQQSTLPLSKKKWEAWSEWRLWPQENAVMLTDLDVETFESNKPLVLFPTYRRILFAIALLISCVICVSLLNVMGLKGNVFLYGGIILAIPIMYFSHCSLYTVVMDKKKKITLERVDQQLYLKYSRSSLVDLGSLDSRQILNMSKADCQRIHKELKRLIVDMTSHPFSSVMPSGEVHPFLQCRMIPPAGIEELATHAEQRFKRKLQIYILELQVMSGSQREFQDARAQLNKININNNWITQLSNRRTALGL